MCDSLSKCKRRRRAPRQSTRRATADEQLPAIIATSEINTYLRQENAYPSLQPRWRSDYRRGIVKLVLMLGGPYHVGDTNFHIPDITMRALMGHFDREY